MSKLRKIEKRITELKKEIASKHEDVLNGAIRSGGIVTQGQLDKMVESENRKPKNELDILEGERQFIVDQKEPLWMKIIWNIVAPIIIAVVTTVITNNLLK